MTNRKGMTTHLDNETLDVVFMTLREIRNERSQEILNVIINSKAVNGVSVTGIMDKVNLTQSIVSKHLKYLRDAGLVSDERIGRSVYYKSVDKAIQSLNKKMVAFNA